MTWFHYYSIMHVHPIFFIHSSAGEHVGWFHYPFLQSP
jgi:hypothetical protein